MTDRLRESEIIKRARYLLALGQPLYDMAEDESWIRCNICSHAPSHNANDVRHHYCAHCQVFLDDVARSAFT